MRLLDFEFINFYGLKLNNIRRFKLNVVSQVTLILGRNGSGKTRLFKQMNILSIQKKDYADNGGKRVTAEFYNVVYRVESFRRGNAVKNTLYDVTNDKVIHKDVNPSYHDEYIRNLTGWTTELHRMIVDPKEQLTSMRAPDRKYWFGKMSESDLAYGLKFYAKLRELTRDLKGAHRNITGEIGELSAMVISNAEEYESASKAMMALREKRDALVSSRDRIISDAAFSGDADQEKLRLAYVELENISNKILGYADNIDSSAQHIDRDYLIGLIGELEYASKDALRQVMSIQKQITDVTDKQSGVDIEELQRWIARDMQTIKDAEDSLTFRVIGDSARVIESNYDSILNAYADVCGERPANITYAEVTRLMEAANAISLNLRKIEGFIDYAEHRISHYEKSDKVKCNKCTHEFVVGYTEEEIAELRVKLVAAHDALKRNKELHEQAIADYKRHADWFARINKYNDVVSVLARTNPIDYEIIRNADHGTIPSVIDSLKKDWATLSIILETKKACAALNERLSAAMEHGPEWLAERNYALEMARELYQNKQTALVSTQKQLDAYYAYYKSCAEIESMKSALDICYNNAEHATKAFYLGLEHEELIGELNHITATLEETSNRFYSLEENRLTLDRLRKQSTEIQANLDVSTELLTAMGPEEGLLAKHLYRSISRVTDEMNDIIRRVWGYPLEVMPCSVDKGELNYKFPYVMEDNTDYSEKEKPEDVSESSVGQRRLFDLVFVLAYYQLNNLKGYPLYLDEPFTGFDEGHQDKSIKFINHQLERNEYSQLFMVSHDPEIHFQLQQVEHVVIDTNGISLPASYNNHVEIE